jgi:hypothetical protein
MLSVIDHRFVTYMDTSIACHMARYKSRLSKLARDHPLPLQYRWI